MNDLEATILCAKAVGRWFNKKEDQDRFKKLFKLSRKNGDEPKDNYWDCPFDPLRDHNLCYHLLKYFELNIAWVYGQDDVSAQFSIEEKEPDSMLFTVRENSLEKTIVYCIAKMQQAREKDLKKVTKRLRKWKKA
jgi:hypothetical protein